jgi:hypothetical protein
MSAAVATSELRPIGGRVDRLRQRFYGWRQQQGVEPDLAKGYLLHAGKAELEPAGVMNKAAISLDAHWYQATYAGLA